MKARIKKIEDFPDFAKCCPRTIEATKPFVGQIYTLIGKPFMLNDKCPFCGSTFSEPSYNVLEMVKAAAIPAECLDIDEGGE